MTSMPDLWTCRPLRRQANKSHVFRPFGAIEERTRIAVSAEFTLKRNETLHKDRTTTQGQAMPGFVVMT